MVGTTGIEPVTPAMLCTIAIAVICNQVRPRFVPTNRIDEFGDESPLTKMPLTHWESGI